MTLLEAQKIFPPEFLQQITSIQINGNFGDIVMNAEGADIVDYFRTTNPGINVEISTNGGARLREFWQQLARAGAQVYFCIDGLEDTLHLYRQNVLYSTVINNAREFIRAGGRAGWKMIRFDHNAHQIAQARQLSQDMGFESFAEVSNDRPPSPVYDRHGRLTHTIDGGQRIEVKDKLRQHFDDDLPAEKYFEMFPVKSNIDCIAKQDRSIYVTSTGEVYPCCYMGFSPRTMGKAFKHLEVLNQQTNAILAPNNALERPIQECMSWFDRVSESWTRDSYQQGRLLVCDTTCGQ